MLTCCKIFIRYIISGKEKYGRHPCLVLMVVHGMMKSCNILRFETLFTFTIREKSNGKGQSIFQRQRSKF